MESRSSWVPVSFAASQEFSDRLCGLVVRVPGRRHRDPVLDSWRYQIFWVAVGLEQSPLSPCEDKWGATWKNNYRLRCRKPRFKAVWMRCTYNVRLFTRKSWHLIRNQEAAARSVWFACGIKATDFVLFCLLLLYWHCVLWALSH
jgi:hypothetical protein